jgi:hypothetical protein
MKCRYNNENKEDTILDHLILFKFPHPLSIKLHFDGILTCFHRLPNEVSQQFSLNIFLYLYFPYSFYSLPNLSTLTQLKLYKLEALPYLLFTRHMPIVPVSNIYIFYFRLNHNVSKNTTIYSCFIRTYYLLSTVVHKLPPDTIVSRNVNQFHFLHATRS